MDNLVQALDRELIKNHRYDTALFAELDALQRASGILHGDRPICPFLRPYFLPARKYRAIGHAAHVLNGAFERITASALEVPEIADELSLSEIEERWARVDPGYECVSVSSRLDTFLNANGFAFLEYNGETPAGVGDQTSLESLFHVIPEVRRFLDENEHWFARPHVALLRALDRAYRNSGGKKAKPNIAIVDWKGVSTGAEFDILREYFLSENYACEICDPRDLQYQNGILRSGDFDIDIFYKRVLIHEFLDEFDESHPLYRALTDGSVCMANSFRSKIPHKKASFAILSDEKYRHLFTPEQRRIADLHIPWTRNVRDTRATYLGGEFDLLDLLRQRKDRFVLKPNDDYGGKGIVIGWETTASEWDLALEAALASPYVAQERVEVEKVEMPFYQDGQAALERLLVDFDPFLFCGTVEGGLVRLSANTLVNVSQGGGETALAILSKF